MIGLDAAKLPSHLGCYSSLESWPQRIASLGLHGAIPSGKLT